MFVSVFQYQAAYKGSTSVTGCHYWRVKGRETEISTCDKQLGVVMRGSDLRRVVAKPMPSLCLGFLEAASFLVFVVQPLDKTSKQAGLQ